MLTAGDELGRTQDGNNNTYCHDSELNYLDWSQAQRDDHQRDHVRGRPEEAEVREERDLEHDRDDHDQRDQK